jgi:hypothetical protein
VVGDSAHRAYCFVEFEDAGANSMFVRQGKKATREWSSRFEHGSNQILDWFYKLEDMQKSDDFAARFEARSISFSGLLVIGRDQFLLPGERERLEWRSRNVVVASRNIVCMTLDGLADELEARLEAYSLTRKSGG